MVGHPRLPMFHLGENVRWQISRRHPDHLQRDEDDPPLNVQNLTSTWGELRSHCCTPHPRTNDYDVCILHLFYSHLTLRIKRNGLVHIDDKIKYFTRCYVGICTHARNAIFPCQFHGHEGVRARRFCNAYAI